jgi:antitoxin (DNA-binding transcriptional repressor) of toxin-antitoxin stability system
MNMSEKMLDVVEAASCFTELIDRTTRLREATTLTDSGTPVARLIPVEAAKTTDELLKAWPNLNHLTPEEAASFEADILAARQSLPPLRSNGIDPGIRCSLRPSGANSSACFPCCSSMGSALGLAVITLSELQHAVSCTFHKSGAEPPHSKT